jgi:hypothetical protein
VRDLLRPVLGHEVRGVDPPAAHSGAPRTPDLEGVGVEPGRPPRADHRTNTGQRGRGRVTWRWTCPRCFPSFKGRDLRRTPVSSSARRSPSARRPW